MTGVLVLNLGTPDSPEPRDVGRYLREFLMDPLVIDLPWISRALLVHGLIVPRRSHASSALYKKVWTEQGSPLLWHTVSLAEKVQSALGEGFVVRPAMRYGKPSIASAVAELKAAGVTRVVALPLYPQYSLAATKSSELALRAAMDAALPGVPLITLPAFYDRPEYLDAVVEVSRPHLRGDHHVLFSFHGLPERQVKRTGSNCLTAGCCDRITAANANCYRAQSFATARALAQRLGLNPGSWEVGFQSRLGRTPWIQPFSDEIYEALPARGVRKLTVLTPSFTADCLETLEEVAIRGNEAFQKAGGHELRLVPSLNDHPAWVRALAEMTKQPLPT